MQYTVYVDYVNIQVQFKWFNASINIQYMWTHFDSIQILSSILLCETITKLVMGFKLYSECKYNLILFICYISSHYGMAWWVRYFENKNIKYMYVMNESAYFGFIGADVKLAQMLWNRVYYVQIYVLY